MKFFAPALFCAIALGSISKTLASQTIEYKHFILTFNEKGDCLDMGRAGKFPTSKSWTKSEIDSLKRAIDTWTKTIKSVPSQKIKILCNWSDLGMQTIGAGTSFTFRSANDKKFGPNIKMTATERLWRNGEKISVPVPLTINMNSNPSVKWYTEKALDKEKIKGAFDLESVLAHEIGHSIGFSTSIRNPGMKQFPPVLTAFDKLISTDPKKAIAPTNYTPGSTYYLGKTGLVIYNPAQWRTASSMAHPASKIDFAFDPLLMAAGALEGKFQRDLTYEEGLILKEMGWNVNLPQKTTKK